MAKHYVCSRMRAYQRGLPPTLMDSVEAMRKLVGAPPPEPVLFTKENVELKPYDLPTSLIFFLDYKYGK